MSNTLLNYFKKSENKTPAKNENNTFSSTASAKKSVEKKVKVETNVITIEEDKENAIKRKLIKDDLYSDDEDDEQISRPLRSCPNSVFFFP